MIATLAELVRIACVLPFVEAGTRLTGPRRLVPLARRVGAGRRTRDLRARAELRRLIGGLDARLSGSSRCYRRVLIEIALDRGAASEKVHLGLHATGGERSGHAWLASEGPAREAFDLVIEL